MRLDPTAEAIDFASPLALQRRGADDQHAADVGQSGEQLGHADALDRLAQSHVVGQHGPAGTDGERDPVQLVGQQFGVEQFVAKRMVRRIAANLLGRLGQPPLQ